MFAYLKGREILKSSDHGEHWKSMGLVGTSSSMFIYKKNIAFVSLSTGSFFRSSDHGRNWIKNDSVNGTLAGSDNILYSYGNQLRFSTDDGISWHNTLTPPLANKPLVGANSASVFIATSTDGIYRSDDTGKTWSKRINGLADPSIKYLKVFPSAIFVQTTQGNFFQSIDNGDHWLQKDTILTGTVIPIGASLITIGKVGATSLLLVSFDGGAHWSPKHSWDFSIDNLIGNETNIFFYFNKKIYHSIDLGTTWIETPSLYEPTIAVVDTLFFNDNNSFDETGILKTSDYGLTWQDANTGVQGLNIASLVVFDDTIFAATVGRVHVFRSVDAGKTWSKKNFFTSSYVVPKLLYNGKTIQILGTSVLQSTDNGENWSGLTTPMGTCTSSWLLGDTLFATIGGANYRTVDNGVTWDTLSGLNGTSYSFARVGSTIFAYNSKIYSSTDGGVHWNERSSIGKLSSGNPVICVVKDHIIFVNSDQGILRSTDTGNSWALSNTGLSNLSFIEGFAAKNEVICVGLGSLDDSRAVAYSNNDGDTWIPITYNLPESGLSSISFVGDDLLIGTSCVDYGLRTGLWKSPLSSLSVKHPLFSDYHNLLVSNFPNPFSTTTTIHFTLPQTTEVSVSLFDPLGKEIVLLQSKILEIGNHSIEWDGSGFPSGIYICKLTAAGISETTKLILCK